MRITLGLLLAIAAVLTTFLISACGNKKQALAKAEKSAPVKAHDNAVHAASPARPRPGTVRDRVRQYGKIVRACWKPYFAKNKIPYPPSRVLLLAIKDAGIMEVYAARQEGKWTFIRSYPILAASGELGPKLREGDGQVPEGRYQIQELNPNSAYHLSLRVNYPNSFDKRMARRDGRRNLGGDIMIHGNEVSIGCLAMGDAVAEDLFILAADSGVRNIKVFITPVDFRLRGLPADMPRVPSWTADLYKALKADMRNLPLPVI